MPKPSSFSRKSPDPHSYTPSVPRAATKSGEGLGPVRLLLAEKYVAARTRFFAIYGGVGNCYQLVGSPRAKNNGVCLIRLNPIPRPAIIHFTALRDALIWDHRFWRSRPSCSDPAKSASSSGRTSAPSWIVFFPRAELTNSRSVVLNRSAASGSPSP